MKIVMDLDNTICITENGDYKNSTPILPVIEKIRELYLKGYYIVIHTARNMRTYEGNVGEININTLPIILEWLKIHNVPFDEVIVGKPWCGFDGYYVDDRAIRPSEFIYGDPESIIKEELNKIKKL